MNSWLSYLFSGVLAVILSGTMTGCRWGNRIEDAKSSDNLTGLYETVPQSAEVCATFIDAPDNPKCLPLDLNDVPSATATNLAGIMSDPVILQLDSQDPTLVHISSPYHASPRPEFVMTVDKNLNLLLDATGNVDTWDASCKDMFVQQYGEGTIQPSNTGPYNKTFGSSTVSIDGRITLEFLTGDFFKGDCASDLQSLTNCLKNSADCVKPTDLQLAQTLFSLYLEKAVLVVDDIPRVASVETHIFYQ